jgi:CheY-like chemotaxis protein
MRTDPTKVRQILINLLGNACKFTRDGYVVVEAFREQDLADWIVLKVHDTGIGISAEEVASLFREFSQGHVTQKPREGGSGLGLAISQGLCQLLGGVISVESKAGVGSTFTVRLPAQLPANPGPRVRRALPPPPGFGRRTDDADDAGKPALLVVDDDADARELVGRVAARLGHRFIEATTADEGLRLALEHEPAAIVLETVLPAQNGWRLLERLKGIAMLDHVPVVVVSVSDDEPRSRRLGATAHLGKPVPTEQLTRTLRDLSRDAAVTEPAGAAS